VRCDHQLYARAMPIQSDEAKRAGLFVRICRSLFLVLGIFLSGERGGEFTPSHGDECAPHAGRAERASMKVKVGKK